MKFRIYQAPFEQTAFGFDPSADYECVWTDEFAEVALAKELGFFGLGAGPDFVEADVTPMLDVIFRDFQRVDPDTGPWPPEGFTGRSLSVGDVVVIDGWAAFSVEPLGFAARDFEPRGLASAR